MLNIRAAIKRITLLAARVLLIPEMSVIQILMNLTIRHVPGPEIVFISVMMLVAMAKENYVVTLTRKHVIGPVQVKLGAVVLTVHIILVA